MLLSCRFPPLESEIQERIVAAVHQIGGADDEAQGHQNGRQDAVCLLRQAVPEGLAQLGGGHDQHQEGIIYAILWVSVLVFPEPAPAKISTGPSV